MAGIDNNQNVSGKIPQNAPKIPADNTNKFPDRILTILPRVDSRPLDLINAEIKDDKPLVRGPNTNPNPQAEPKIFTILPKTTMNGIIEEGLNKTDNK